MTDAELRRAIEQAWLHTYKTGARCGLREALEHLEALREEQRRRARSADTAEKYNDRLNDDPAHKS